MSETKSCLWAKLPADATGGGCHRPRGRAEGSAGALRFECGPRGSTGPREGEGRFSSFQVDGSSNDPLLTFLLLERCPNHAEGDCRAPCLRARAAAADCPPLRDPGGRSRRHPGPRRAASAPPFSENAGGRCRPAPGGPSSRDDGHRLYFIQQPSAAHSRPLGRLSRPGAFGGGNRLASNAAFPPFARVFVSIRLRGVVGRHSLLFLWGRWRQAAGGGASGEKSSEEAWEEAGATAAAQGCWSWGLGRGRCRPNVAAAPAGGCASTDRARRRGPRRRRAAASAASCSCRSLRSAAPAGAPFSCCAAGPRSP